MPETGGLEEELGGSRETNEGTFKRLRKTDVDTRDVKGRFYLAVGRLGGRCFGWLREMEKVLGVTRL